MTSLPTQYPETSYTAAETMGDEHGTNVGVVDELGFAAENGRRAGIQCNIGRSEQKFRLGMGTALLAAAAFAPLSRGWRIGLSIVGAAELITGTTRYCPISQALGINTCAADER
jgi:Protein of unknown function (DUF2892)